MSNQTFRCPRCGKELNYDVAMGLWWCPDVECGTVLRKAQVPEQQASGDSKGFCPPNPPLAHGLRRDEEEEWQPRGWSTGQRVAAALVALLTTVAVLMMGLSPLSWFRGAAMSVSPHSVIFIDDFGKGTMPQAIAIQNDGKGEMDWEVTTDVSWLTVEPSQGILAEGLQIVTLRVDISGLAVGEYDGICTIASEDCRNSPQTVPVLLKVEQTSETRAIHDLVGDGVEVFYGEQPPYVEGPNGDEINLVNNDLAGDVSWSTLATFLAMDATDESPYVQGERMCGTFAEMLHNNAEAGGIRAAWVSVDMVGQEIGHALNAFLTTDRGVVFVDCTGEDAGLVVSADQDVEGCDYDKIAFVKKGEEYGLISLKYAESPEYAFYAEYAKAWSDYLADLDEFNVKADEYNALTSGSQLVAGSSEARDARSLYSELERRRVSLDMQSQLLGPCRWDAVGVVERAALYW